LAGDSVYAKEARFALYLRCWGYRIWRHNRGSNKLKSSGMRTDGQSFVSAHFKGNESRQVDKKNTDWLHLRLIGG